MKVKLSPLQLEFILFEKEKFEINLEYCSNQYKLTDNTVSFEVDFGKVEIDSVSYKGIKFSLVVNKSKKYSPFKVELRGIAMFSVEKGKEDNEKLERIFIFNGTSIVYSFLRGYVFAKLGTLPPNCRILPTLNLVNIINSPPRGGGW